jgi:hypothetical protein
MVTSIGPLDTSTRSTGTALGQNAQSASINNKAASAPQKTIRDLDMVLLTGLQHLNQIQVAHPAGDKYCRTD